MVFYWPVICSSDYRAEPIAPMTLGESAGLHGTDIKGLCLQAIYQLLAEGKLTIADVHEAYQRGASSS